MLGIIKNKSHLITLNQKKLTTAVKCPDSTSSVIGVWVNCYPILHLPCSNWAYNHNNPNCPCSLEQGGDGGVGGVAV